MPQLTRRRFLSAAGAAGAAALAAEVLPKNVRQALAAGPPKRPAQLSGIKHVVILMRENRGFNHYFGTLPNVRGFSDPTATTLSTGLPVFHQPVPTAPPAKYFNPDGYLLPFLFGHERNLAEPVVCHDLGKMVYATNPIPGTLTEINTADNKVKAVVPAGDEPYAVAVSPDSKSVYVTDMNSNSVRVIDAKTNKTKADVAVQGLPASLALTPDGARLWVGSILTGNVSVIDPMANKVSRTVTSGLPAQAMIDAAPMAFAFVKP